MYCVYGNSSCYIHGGALFVGGPLLGGCVIRGSTAHTHTEHVEGGGVCGLQIYI